MNSPTWLSANQLLIIAGPCQIESFEHCSLVLEHLLEIRDRFKFSLVFKSSFDKANRTKRGSERGPGIEEGLEILARVRTHFGVPVTTDIHLPEQAKRVAESVDLLQIPAFLCRQTDLLEAAGATGAAVNIKKGQFLHPSDMKFAMEKVKSTGAEHVLLTERGTCFGYRDLVVDMRSLQMMREFGAPVIFDATHSVQSMGGSGTGVSGGSREFIPTLARAAVAAGVNGIFFECHEDPERAPSDGKSTLPLSEVETFLEQLCRLYELRQAF